MLTIFDLKTENFQLKNKKKNEIIDLITTKNWPNGE